MIEAPELRIGNWVYDEDGNPTQIEELPAIKDPYKFRWEWVKHLKPIELTEEWLLRMGFTLVNGWDLEEPNPRSYEILGWGSVYLKNGVLDTEQYYFLTGLNQSIKYVHQLQNLYFAMNGQELTIKDI